MADPHDPAGRSTGPLDRFTVLAWRAPACPAAVLEQATLPMDGARLQEARQALGVPGLFHVATCQRVLWVLQDAPPDVERRLEAFYAPRTLPRPERWDGFPGFRHLAEVASSMDSLVPGEPQVLGQVKAALQACDAAAVMGKDLRHVFDLVLRTAKAVRSQTSFFEGKVSLLPLLEDAMRDALAPREAPVAAVVGTGEMAARSMALLRRIRPDCGLVVASRDAERARHAAQETAAAPTDLARFLEAPPRVDLVVLASECQAPFVSAAWMAAQAAVGPLTILDVGMPRNAEAPPAPIPGLRLVQLDEMVAMSQKARARREAAYEDARRILEDELDRVEQDYNARCHASTLHQLAKRFEEVAQARWQQGQAHVDVQDAKARKWYEQTVRALLHEAAQAVKRPGGDGPR